jgi:hypothetical protein
MTEVSGSTRCTGAPGPAVSTRWYRRSIVLVPCTVVAVAAAVVIGVPYLHGNAWLLRHAPAAIVAIKVVHTIAWLSIEACLLYMLYTGIVRRSDRRAGVAAAVVACESLIFAANGFRCPLTDLAESLGATNGAVVDIYLPAWFADTLPLTHGPLFVLAALLHARNLRTDARRRRAAARPDPG